MAEEIIITQADYIASAVRPEQYPTGNLPEIAFWGRSNVGKSSLINSLTRRHNLARVSGQPGKTQTVNFFSLTAKQKGTEERREFYLVDLPGYGYAKTGKENRKRWAEFIEEYFRRSKNLRCICLLADLRHDPMPIDLKTFHWLVDLGMSVLLIGTKADKISTAVCKKHLAAIRQALNIEELEILPYSAVKNTGRPELLATIWDSLA